MRPAVVLAALLAGACSRPAAPVDNSFIEEDTPLYRGAKKSSGCGETAEYGRKIYFALLGASMDQQPRYASLDAPPAAVRALMRAVPAEPKALYARYMAARAEVQKMYPERFVEKKQADSMMIGWDLAGEYLKPGYDLSRTECTFRLQEIHAGSIGDIGSELVVFPEMAVPGHADTQGRLVIHGGYFCSSECKWDSYILSIVDKKPYAEYTSNWNLTREWGWPQKEMDLPGWEREE